MSPGNQRDWSGLLYLPGEELVRSTIDGDDADWSESLSYVPSDTVVHAVLDASVRDRPTFLLPTSLLPSDTALGSQSRARRTAALLVGLGLSPFSLAAAAVLHMAFLLAVGPWIVTQASAARSIQRPTPPPPIVVTRLVYSPPTSDGSPPIASARRRPSPANARSSPVDTGTARTASPSQLDSGRTGAWQATQKSAAEREAANALRQELFFTRDGFDLEVDDTPKFELIVRVLTRWPRLRVRVLGAAPRRREPGPVPGMAEAEAMKRALVQAGIDGARIDVGQVPEAERFCPEREPLCAAARRRVRTMVWQSP